MAGKRLNSSIPYLDLFKLLCNEVLNGLTACAERVAEQKGWKTAGVYPTNRPAGSRGDL